MSQVAASRFDSGKRSHPRTIGWGGTTALAMGGSNQMGTSNNDVFGACLTAVAD